jgi:hypothetical protein
MNKKRNITTLKIKQFHFRMRELKKEPKFCEDCKKVPPRDLASISHKYLNDIKDYKYLCRLCHQKMDYKNGKRKSPFIGVIPWNKGIKSWVKPWLGKKRPEMKLVKNWNRTGCTPWNKGLKGWSKGTKAGFKKGNIYGKYRGKNKK